MQRDYARSHFPLGARMDAVRVGLAECQAIASISYTLNNRAIESSSEAVSHSWKPIAGLRARSLDNSSYLRDL